MAKWVGWIAYAFWGLLCFLVFSHLLFPYETLGRRILYTFQEEANLIVRSSEPVKRVLGIQWARVDILSPNHEAFPPIQIEDWVIQLRPLSLFMGQLSLTSHGTFMGGSFQTNLVMERKGQHGRGRWDGVRLDRFPLFWMEGASVNGVANGTVLWKRVGQGFDGETSFEVQGGGIENLSLGGFTLPSLDLGRIEGRMVLKDEKIELEEISAEGGDLRGRLTGQVLLKDPLIRSRLACRLELEPSETLVNRYPVIKALIGGEQGQSSALLMAIGGTVETPRIAPTR
jgi:type II secretion system protein N